VSVRLDEDLIAWADEYGRAMRWDRSTVIVAALEQLRDDAARGVPDPPKTVAENLRETERGEVVKAKPDRSASFELPHARPQREQFSSGEEWQNAVRLWRVRQG